jgi:hypothetical protein
MRIGRPEAFQLAILHLQCSFLEFFLVDFLKLFDVRSRGVVLNGIGRDKSP